MYLQDHLVFGARTTLTIGGRWDRATNDAVTDEKFSPRVGATYELIPGTALYASGSRSFTPQPGYMTSAGDPLPPETGTNIEMGLKTAAPDGRLSGMLSVFELTRQNVATSDPANPFNLYAEYVVPQGPLARLGMHASYLYNSHKNATLFPEDLDADGKFDPVSLFQLPEYSIVDLGVSYPVGAFQFRLNVNNVLDERYFPDACCVDRVTPGEPRNWQLSVSTSF